MARALPDAPHGKEHQVLPSNYVCVMECACACGACACVRVYDELTCTAQCRETASKVEFVTELADPLHHTILLSGDDGSGKVQSLPSTDCHSHALLTDCLTV
jgi:hypothetical protein